ncbi:ShlB/FhaC/HecB family hemolysin secretion/activation protein [Marinobacter sp. 1_MG-2023]|uniref:ShlB/FhaC/HecB family hemolysin secretion/activation protein n=1 Tax=Marinobacter sp. 1_MG-2023 TaxID=3062627 RepID=UPI0026E245D9|nr:ShlB/FhaC/HecB family hemolysin secretion/activation protein [Marinobacter sp. 1_MG-2023]MDO6824608.1 ShlB/FhaC/HecB family hemolysin secretion/activation protein [Marinobacter sp. 1_MG-2023]
MGRTLLAALIFGFFTYQVSANNSKTPADSALWDLYPADLLQSVTQYVASHMEFSGNSSQTNDRSDGSINLISNDLIWSQHVLGLNFSDSVAREGRAESTTLALRYAFPLAGSNFRIDLENRDYAGAVSGSGQRYDTRGEYRNLKVTGNRSLWAWQGIEIDSVFSHSSGSSSAFEEALWVESSTHRLSSFGLQGSASRDLLGGLYATTSLTAVGGVDSEEIVNSSGRHSDVDGFHRLAVAASLSREVLSWNLGLNGRYQFAPDDLPASEYLRIAGPGLMRGFNGQSVHVAKGGWLRMNARSPDYHWPFVSELNSTITFSLLQGWAPYSAAQSDRSGTTSTGEISLQLYSRDFRADLSIGQMLNASNEALLMPTSPDLSLSFTVGI